MPEIPRKTDAQPGTPATGCGSGGEISATKDARKTGGRQYPRVPSEVGFSVARSQYEQHAPYLAELREAWIEDQGGEAEISVAKLELMERALGAAFVVMALEREIAETMKKSLKGGHVPRPSQYKATALLPTWLATIKRLFEAVGLDRVKRRISIEEYRGAAQDPGESS